MAEVGEWRDLRERNQSRSAKTRIRPLWSFGPKPCGPMDSHARTNAQAPPRADQRILDRAERKQDICKDALPHAEPLPGWRLYSDRRCEF